MERRASGRGLPIYTTGNPFGIGLAGRRWNAGRSVDIRQDNARVTRRVFQERNLIMRKMGAVQIADNMSLARARRTGRYVEPCHNRVLAGQTL
jgi:hypothetical protein